MQGRTAHVACLCPAARVEGEGLRRSRKLDQVIAGRGRGRREDVNVNPFPWIKHAVFFHLTLSSTGPRTRKYTR